MSLHIITLRLAVCALALTLASRSGALESVALRLEGGEAPALSEELQANSVLKSLEGKPGITPTEVVAAARAEYARLVEVLYAQGYYSGVVNVLIDGREAARMDPFDEPANVRSVSIIVKPGRLFRFGKADIAPLATTGPPVEGFRKGAPAYATAVREATQQAIGDWRKAGYAKAGVAAQSILARHATAQLDADIRISPGPQVTFGDVVATGQSTVRMSRVRQIAGIPQGALFTPDAVDKAAARLRKTGTFKSVQVTESDTVDPDGSMDIEIAVVDRKPRRIGGGLEFSSFDGLTLSGYWLHRNLLGGAERFRVDSEIAQLGGQGEGVDYSLSFRFEKPAVYGADTLFFAEAGAYYLDEPDFLEEKAELTLGVSQEFNDRLSGDLGLGYSFSRVTDRYATPRTTRELQLISLPVGLAYDSRDNPLDAREGGYLRAELTPFYETRSAQAGGHLKFDGRGYRALGKDGTGTVAALRLQLGVLVGPDAQDAPPGFLFYSGGGGTVRGQPYKSLGADYGGVTLGGRSFAALSAELRFPLRGRLGLVAFADAGFVSSELFESGDWHAGAGLGLRYKTPVGPIRVDLAGPVAGDTGDGLQVYIGIGQAF